MGMDSAKVVAVEKKKRYSHSSLTKKAEPPGTCDMKPLKSLRTTDSANPGWLRRLVRPRLIILRGVSGSGKTTHAKTLGISDHYEADQWFEANGGYNHDKIKQAHEWCQNQAITAMKNGRDVVVSNTFCRLWEMQPYLDAAKKTGHEVIVTVMTGKWQNVHGVPEKIVAQMIERFEWPNILAEPRQP